jgi:pyruvate dehydrogenase E2 component (dihydrolipoamide acetyltransferase)
MTRLQMPMFGLTMTEGAIAKWLRNEGEAVRKGDPLFEVETDKSVMEYEAPEDGVLLKILAPAEKTVPVGEVVGLLGQPGETIAAPPPPAEPVRSKITPRARKLAEERRVDWTALRGSGPGGLITDKDIPVPAAAPRPLPNHRRVIAERLVRSAQERPHIHLTLTIDMTAALEFREQKGCGWNDLLVRAAALALRDHPRLNAAWAEDTVRENPRVNVGLAVAAGDDNLLAPVVEDADRKALAEIGAELRQRIAEARAGKLDPARTQGGTFTISNLGMFGVEQFTAIINPPQSAIVAVGAVRQEPCVLDGQIAIRPRMSVTLGVDHRVADGAAAGRFLERLRALLEEPERLQ